MENFVYIILESQKAYFHKSIAINPILCGEQKMEPYSKIEHTKEQ